MAKQNINVGITANDKKGDSLRAAFTKVNANFTELYTALGLTDTTLNLGAFEFTGSVMTTNDSSNMTIGESGTVINIAGDLVPSVANGGDLGSPSKPWNSLYVSNNTIYIGGVSLSLDADNNLLINNSSISSEIEYASIPNAPTDISDLTDDGGLLGGGSSLTVGNGTSTSIENVTEILINGTITEIESGVVDITIDGGGSTADPNIWVQTFESQDGAPTDIVSIASSVEYDSAGNVIALFSHFNDNDNNRYYSVGKYTTTGTKIWTARFEDGFQTDGWGLAVDNDSNSIYVAGQTLVSGESGYSVSTLTKLDSSDGSIEWSKVYDFGFESQSSVVDVDSDGNPIMVGYASNGLDNYITTTKVDPADGTIIWSRALNGQGDEKALGMAVGPTGEVVAVGYMSQLGVQDAAETLSVDPASNPLWTVSGSINFVNGITADYSFTDGVPTFTNVVDTVGGRSVDDVIVTVLGDDLGGVTGVDDMIVKVATLAANDTDDRMIVVKYDSTGVIQWQKAIQFDAGFDCRGADADIDSDGNIYVTGSYRYSFEGGTTSALSILKLDSTGVKQWSRRVTGNCETFGVSVVVGADDKLYLSAVTGNNNDVNNAFTWVAAKYGFDGTVEWQRLIDNTTGWSFTGDIFFGDEGGGSNIAVKDGYVVLGGGFGLLVEEPPRATLVQVAATGDAFSVGDWAFTAASFSGVLDSSASDITVVDAQKTDADNGEGEVTVTTAELTTEVSGFLIGTLYTVGGVDRLVNGEYEVVLGSTGTLTLPAGGTITEGYVTSNPTIQLTPASPDVASQKLVIKGGILYDYTDNGININYYTNTAIVGDTLTFYINSPTYADQTLYWWIYPEGAGISDPGSGTVVLDGSSGTISFVLDSDDNEFTIRVSPEANNYDPASLGVESGLINPDAPTFDSEHHLHLTTGDLSETSIFLGTDDHNVRTTVNGGVEINTYLYPSGGGNAKWTFGTDGTTTFPGSRIKAPPGDFVGFSDNAGKNFVTVTDTQVDISVEDTTEYNWTFGTDGTLTIPGDIQSENGISVRINLTDSTQRVWRFGEDGDLTLPGGGSVDGSDYDVEIIAGNDGASTFGSVTINTQAPPAVYTVVQQSSPVGFDAIYTTIIETPYIANIVPGMTVTGSGITTPTTVASVTGPDEFGTYTINLTPTVGAELSYLETYTFTSAGGVTNRIWDFNSLGELYLPQGGAIQETTVTNELWGTTTTSLTLVPAGAANGTQRLEIYATGGGEGDHIHITSGDQNVTDVFLGNDTQYFAVSSDGANNIQARNGAASTGPGVSAGPGANVNISAGSAGDNGGNIADGNSGGDVFIASGISTSGLGGDILINTSSGPDGFGSIELSTDGGSSYWAFNKDNQIVFPDSTVQTTAWPGSVTRTIQTVSVQTPTGITGSVVFADANAAGGNVNLVLPNNSANGTEITVKNINAGGFSVFVSTDGVQNIETESGSIGSGVYATISTNGSRITWIYQSSTTTWRIIG